jgi:hypothetical protein
LLQVLSTQLVLTAKVELPFPSRRHTPGTNHSIAAASANLLLPLLRVQCNAVGVDRQGLAAFLAKGARAKHKT